MLFCASGGGKTGFERVRGGLQRGGAARVSSGAADEGMAVRLCAGSKQFAATGAAHTGRFGISVFGGWGATGFLDAERISQAARAGHQRWVHAGGGVGAVAWAVPVA